MHRLVCRWLVGLMIAPIMAHGADQTTEYKKDAGPHKVASVLVEWKDAKRTRTVPAKIYYPQTSQGPFAVVLFSHGLGGSREGYGYLGRHWAGHGYVCIHLQHEGSDEAIWKGQKNANAQFEKAAKDPKNAVNRPLDVSFAIDQLTTMQTDQGSPLNGKLDLGRIAMAGHSFGAMTTLMIAGESATKAEDGTVLADARVKAGIPLSSPVPAKRKDKEFDAVYSNIQIPLLHITGTLDESPVAQTKAQQRRIPYDHITHADQYLITLVGGDHKIFNGPSKRGPVKEKDARFHELILMSTTAFLDAYLKDDQTAKEWLQAGGMKTAMGNLAKVEQKRGKKGFDMPNDSPKKQ